MKCLLMGVVLLVLGTVAIGAGVRAKPPEPPLMQRKLAYSQEILSGLATADLKGVAQSARALSALTDEQWRREDTPEYRANLTTFRFATEEVARLATEKNLEGATLAYVQVTLSCVSCHKQLRKEKM